ncbi:insulin-like 3 [Perognathus longimembris pacificus]|uniref:insulin-like 3 n=1 Tax=Perognathus longimembris pacificus TaxID=214514 RepID=UPI00201A2302|nr:insulin-like 3 [Perognathus longimembris pacificus]
MHPELLLLLLLLLPSPHPALVGALAARERLCGHRLVRELVRVCGAPRWSPEVGGDWELVPWLEVRRLHTLGASGDPQPGRETPAAFHRRRRAVNPVHRCCVLGCAQHDLVGFCPH